MAIDLSKEVRSMIVKAHGIDTSDFGDLVSQLGKDPKIFFEGKDWRGVDFRETDVRGISFLNANLSCAIVDKTQFKYLRESRMADTSGLIIKSAVVRWSRETPATEIVSVDGKLHLKPEDEPFWYDIPEDSGAPREVIDFSEANMRIKSAVENGEQPPISDIDQLIKSAYGTESVKAVLEVLQHIDYSPSLRDMNLLLTRCSNFSDASGLFDRFPDYRIKPNIDTYTRLISKTRVFDLANSVSNRMEIEGVRKNRQFYNRLLGRTHNLRGAKGILGQMRAHDIAPNASTYNTILSKCQDYKSAVATLEELEAGGFQANVKTFNRLIAKLHEFQEAFLILKKMNHGRIAPDNETIRLLMNRVKSGTQALTVVEVAKNSWMEISKESYQSALNVSIGEPLDDLIEALREDGWDVINSFGQRIESSKSIRGGEMRIVERNPLGL